MNSLSLLPTLALLGACQSENQLQPISSPNTLPADSGTAPWPEITPSIGPGTLASMCALASPSLCATNNSTGVSDSSCAVDMTDHYTASSEALQEWVQSDILSQALNGQEMTLAVVEWHNPDPGRYNQNDIASGNSTTFYFMLGDHVDYARQHFMIESLPIGIPDDFSADGPAVLKCDAYLTQDYVVENNSYAGTTEDFAWAATVFFSEDSSSPEFFIDASSASYKNIETEDSITLYQNHTYINLGQESSPSVEMKYFEPEYNNQAAHLYLTNTVTQLNSISMLGDRNSEEYYLRGAIFLYKDGEWILRDYFG